ncbi:GNAT family N-acetyltransferase [Streptomyces griseomycini]|uniref:GNAT family N-acetyltransferase n=1 Tax=Streptomyces griseomycini TaxID=66895 RepID=UPI001E63AAEC|nr:GNAT family N-acetyltransferase [Streptomyces griseomycini]
MGTGPEDGSEKPGDAPAAAVRYSADAHPSRRPRRTARPPGRRTGRRRPVPRPRHAGDRRRRTARARHLERHRRAGRCWVAADERDRPAGYLIAEPVDGALHVEQVSVHPRAARRGVGRALLAHAARCAREEGLTALTLTTFAEVPWNAPYYARLGFRTLAGPDLTPGLRRIRAEESGHGLDRWPRVCMRIDLPWSGAASARLPG